MPLKDSYILSSCIYDLVPIGASSAASTPGSLITEPGGDGPTVLSNDFRLADERLRNQPTPSTPL